MPDGYEYIGDLPEESANDTGLAGCKMYAIKELDSFPDFYLYQECGTPVSEDTVDNTLRQWAYVQWICSGMPDTVESDEQLELIPLDASADVTTDNFDVSAVFKYSSITISVDVDETVINTIPIEYGEYKFCLDMLDAENGYVIEVYINSTIME